MCGSSIFRSDAPRQKMPTRQLRTVIAARSPAGYLVPPRSLNTSRHRDQLGETGVHFQRQALSRARIPPRSAPDRSPAFPRVMHAKSSAHSLIRRRAGSWLAASCRSAIRSLRRMLSPLPDRSDAPFGDSAASPAASQQYSTSADSRIAASPAPTSPAAPPTLHSLRILL